MDRALDAPAPAEAGPPIAGPPIAGSAAGELADSDAANMSLETMLRRSLLAAERAALAGNRGQAAALLIPVVELTRVLSENAAFVDQRDQLIELREQAEALLRGDGTALPSPPHAPPAPPPPPLASLPPSSPSSPLRSPPVSPAASIPPGRAGELDTLLQSTADEIDRLEQIRRRIAAL